MTKLLSASRLNAFQACRHQTALWLQGVKPPERADDTVSLIRAKGFEHEAVVVESLRATHGEVVEIVTEGPLEQRVEQTYRAMFDGAAVIYQAALTDGRWIGFPDFLIRTGQTADGRWAYVPEDAKLSRKAKAEHLVQLGVYAELVEPVTGERPVEGAIHGSGGPAERFKLSETQHITQRMMRQFEAFIDAPEETRPVKNAACGLCDFAERCTAEWRAADSPVFIAGARGDQIIKLEKAGIRTLTEIAALPPETRVPGIGDRTLAKLVAQARLQLQGVQSGQHIAEILPSEPLRGFAILPPPEAGDLFYDIEGDPLYPEGLEYLHGLWGPFGADGSDGFKALWAHDHKAEKASFEQLMDLFKDHLDRFPKAHIYHYAPYERTALKRLAMKYATREAELDQLFRDQRFVDLYAVVKSGIRASTESYSLKDLEKIYWGKRSGEVTNAGDSIVEYERWRELGDAAILESIERYNEDDCVSTAKLREWLEGLRPADAPYGLEPAMADEPAEPTAKALERAQFERDRIALAEEIRNQEGLEPELRELLAELLWFHQRSQKPQWWALFDRQTWTDEELVEDAESLGGLELVSQTPDARSFVATYRFPEQDTKLKEGDRPRIALTLDRAGSVVELDLERKTVVLRRQSKSGDFPERASLSPGQLIDQTVLEHALMAVVKRLAKGDFETDRAVLDMLRRNAPRFRGRPAGQTVIAADEDLIEGATRALRDLDETALIVQGPPGTGKTYTTAHAITELLQDGKRVAVSSNSHKAINNLLEAVSKRCEKLNFALRGVKKASQGDPETAFKGYGVISVGASEGIQRSHHLVGATAFEFAKHDPNSFDYLFVDEAGQVALGNLLAMAGCAKNLVLVGDQMQLPQPVQGVHPGETGLSSMDYAMQDHPTVPPERGILLNVSWRMHPDVCSFISDAVYEGRLQAEASTSTQRLVLSEGLHSALKQTGISTVDIDHHGCTQSSEEEAAMIGNLIEQLLGQSWIDTAGVEAPITLKDIVVVSPFNMQVTLLKKRLPRGARVGTVDKFQGQEAPVVLVSMATSFGGDAPRGTEFLFNRNRLNVAISRAKCLAVIIKGKRLLELPAPGLQDLPRLDLLARAEQGGRV